MMLSAVLAAAALLSGVSAQLTINTPTTGGVPGTPECVPLLIQWSGGTPPYFVTLNSVPPAALPILSYNGVSVTQETWTVNVTTGTQLLLSIKDNTGAGQTSAPFPVVAGAGDGCLTASSSSSASASSTSGSSTASSSSTSSSSSVSSTSSSTPVTTSTSTTTSISSVTSIPASTSVRPTASSVSASVSVTTSPSPSTTSNAGFKAGVPAGAVAVLGAAAVAAFQLL